MASNIGIKIANGEFYPIMEENSSIRKRLILTTVHDNQPSVQIDLYRSTNNTMTDAQYIGSLVVESIKPKPKCEPSIEMVISSNKDGDIIAEAIDLDTSAGGEHYVLNVSLKSLDETVRDMDIPDFELETNEEPPSGLYNAANRIRQNQSNRPPVWVFILLGLLLILGLFAAWLFLMGGMDKICGKNDTPSTTQIEWQETPRAAIEPVREPEHVSEPEPARQPEPVREPVTQPETAQTQNRQEPVPVIQAPASRPPASQQQTSARSRNPPVASYNVPAVIPREGVNYKIRWGDTLWDISEAFYRDPWLYPRIARHNNIQNPDLIISGRTIRIPPKN